MARWCGSLVQRQPQRAIPQDDREQGGDAISP